MPDLQYVHLDDGRHIPWRPIQPGDAVPLQALHRGHSDRTRYLRFLSYYPELSDRQAERFANVDGHDRLAIVALDPDDPDVIIGVVRLDREEGTNTAEYAAVVTDKWQGLGLGHGLTVALLREARLQGIERIFAIVQPGNMPMLGLLKGLNIPWQVTRDGGVERVEIGLGQVDEELT
jgi:GNAT superfamily N-acetyltransferase